MNSAYAESIVSPKNTGPKRRKVETELKTVVTELTDSAANAVLENIIGGNSEVELDDVNGDNNDYSDGDINDDGEKKESGSTFVYPCEKCNQVFASMYGLLHHEKVMHHIRYSGPKKYECIACAHKLPSEHHLKLHVQSKHGVDNIADLKTDFECEICGKALRTSFLYHQHCKKVHDVKPEKPEVQICETCGKQFARKDTLNWHVKTIHLGMKRPRNDTGPAPRKFACDKCGKTFKRRQHLDDHIGVNHQTEDLKYKCTRCPKTFIRPHILEYHTNKIHLNQKPHKCKNCLEGFYSAVSLKKHFRLCSMSESQKHKCKDCGQLFTTVRNLRMHREALHSSHPLTCACGVIVKWRSSFAKHKRKCQFHNPSVKETVKSNNQTDPDDKLSDLESSEPGHVSNKPGMMNYFTITSRSSVKTEKLPQNQNTAVIVQSASGSEVSDNWIVKKPSEDKAKVALTTDTNVSLTDTNAPLTDTNASLTDTAAPGFGVESIGEEQPGSDRSVYFLILKE